MPPEATALREAAVGLEIFVKGRLMVKVVGPILGVLRRRDRKKYEVRVVECRIAGSVGGSNILAFRMNIISGGITC